MKFAILALPRSGTAWAANWLSTEGVTCFHDPWERMSPSQVGENDAIACTTSWLLPRLLKQVSERRVVLERPLKDVNTSLRRKGLGTVSTEHYDMFRGVDGLRLPWTALWEEPERIWRYLRDDPYDIKRWQEMQRINVQTDLARWQPSLEHIEPWL